jgi:hypothetical protein
LVIARDPWEMFFEGTQKLPGGFTAVLRVQRELEQRA